MASVAALLVAGAGARIALQLTAPKPIDTHGRSELEDALAAEADAITTKGLLPRRRGHVRVHIDDGKTPIGATPLPDLTPLMKAITVVSLSHQSLDGLPEELLALPNLHRLSLGSNAIKALPAAPPALPRNLVDLDLGRNQLASVPDWIGDLPKLRFLNLMANDLTTVPDSICRLRKLYRLGLKSNRLTALPDALGDLSDLVELFITDNLLTALPESMGRCRKLVKLQASYNRLQSLPASLSTLPKLELMRVAVNEIPSVPEGYSQMPRLSWFSLAGNPVCPEPPPPRKGIEAVAASKLEMGEALGDGASGDVYLTYWEGRQVAVKVFKAETSPDGRAVDELAIATAVDHPNIVRVSGLVTGTNSACPALLQELVQGKALAEKPNFVSLLRCRWAAGETFEAKKVVRTASQLADALAYLHGCGVCHGDVYAHNLLGDEEGNATLCDFGASFFYPPSQRAVWEPMEVRAFGLLLHDLTERLAPGTGRAVTRSLRRLVAACTGGPRTGGDPSTRPTFKQVVAALEEIAV